MSNFGRLGREIGRWGGSCEIGHCLPPLPKLRRQGSAKLESSELQCMNELSAKYSGRNQKSGPVGFYFVLKGKAQKGTGVFWITSPGRA